MPLFLINARDKAGALDLRLATREAHLAWVGDHAAIVLMAGPVFQDDGETMAGSTFVIEADDLAAARAWAADDPYSKAGVFDTVEIRPFRWAIGDGPRS